MLQLDEFNLLKEKKAIEENFRDSLKEMRKISSFLKSFIKINKEMIKSYANENNLKDNENKKEKNEPLKNTNSFLFSNISYIYESFNVFMKTSQNLMISMENDLVKPLDDFIKNQLDCYNKDLNQIKMIKYEENVNKSIHNYYKSSYISNKIDPNEIDNSIMRGANDLNIKRDILIKKKMIARKDEFIYKYETAKYNKNILNLNENYNSLIDNILSIEKNKVHFLQSILDKYKNYLVNYIQFINNFINKIDKFNSKGIGEKEIIDQNNIFTKFQRDSKDNNNLRIPKIKFISYLNYYEALKEKKSNRLDTLKRVVINPSLQIKENECNNLIKDVINNLLGENDICQENIAQIFLNC